MRPGNNGYLFGVSAYLIWGLFPLYWKLLRPSGALEILAHRVIWSFVFVGVLVTASRGWRRVRDLVRRPRKAGLIGLAAVVIGANWGIYIYAVNSDQVVEASLGYFINPLVTVLLGVLVLRERLRPGQWVAIGIGVAAVAVLTAEYGRMPYLALTLAVSFALYGLIKKRLAVPAMDGLLAESAALTLPAAWYVVAISVPGSTWGSATFGRQSTGHTLLLVLAGAVTAVPLLLFAGAANRIPLSTIGLLQYLTPTLQLACGVVVYGEPMPPMRFAGFALVWGALVVFTWDGVRQARHDRRLNASALAPPEADRPLRYRQYCR